MKRIRPITEDEVVATFLQCELGSPRFGEQLRRLLRQDGRETSVVSRPDLARKEDNVYRRRLLGRVKGFEEDRSLFRGFPAGVAWERAVLTADELKRALYINYDYLVELSGGSRLPADAAQRVRAGVEVFRQPNENYWKAFDAWKAGRALRELIFVTHDRQRLVILEGHVRLTALMLEPDLVPGELEVILGRSPEIASWPLY